MKQPGAIQSVVWIALGCLAFLFLKWRNDDIEATASRLNPVAADSGTIVNRMDSLPKPFERLRAPALIAPRRKPSKPRAARLRAYVGDSVPVSLTAYCLRGETRTGTTTREGVIAADPKVFPLNSELDIFVGGKLLGRFKVEDTGLLIKGRILDVWLPNCSDARVFGRKRAIALLLPKIRR